MIHPKICELKQKRPQFWDLLVVVVVMLFWKGKKSDHVGFSQNDQKSQFWQVLIPLNTTYCPN